MATDLAIDLLTSILTFDPSTRLSAAEALQHSYLEKIRGYVIYNSTILI